jgi:hypothetical protein
MKKENVLANDRVVQEVWVITDIDESTNEGYGAERAIFPFDEKFNINGYTFKNKEDAERVIRDWLGKNGFNVVSEKVKVMKATISIGINSE